MFSIRTSYKSARSHPFLSCILFLVLILYRVFPSLFAFLLSSSPVIICTSLLLGSLLSYGAPRIPEIEEEDKKTQEISSLKVGSIVDDLVVRKDDSHIVETHVETSAKANDTTSEGTALREASASAAKAVGDVPFTPMHDEGDQKDYTLMAANASVEEDKKERHSEEKFTEEREVQDHAFVEKREVYADEQAEGMWKVDKDVGGLSMQDQKEFEALTVHIANHESENLFDSNLGSPWQAIGSHDASSGSESDSSESSSPDASMADIIPMLDELHPLLNSEAPQPVPRSTGDSDVASSGSSQDRDSDNGSAEENVDRKEDDDREQLLVEKDDHNEVAVTWTADDQKNVMDLGVSEIERNQRLENLIAKRRARKLQRFETEKNLIDLDSYYPTSIPSISAPRRNPFDLPYDLDGNMGLPPIPGSAPSVMQPRQNPFDLPSEKVEEISSLSKEYLNHHDFVPPRDMFSRRHESFKSESTFSMNFDQKRNDSHLKPYFVSQRTDLKETGFPAFQRKSEKSDSGLSSVSESNIALPVTNKEDRKGLITKQEVHEEIELSSSTNHKGAPAEQGHQSSKVVDSVDFEQELRGSTACDDRAIDLDASKKEAEEKFTETEDSFPISLTGKLEGIEERREEPNFSSEENEMHIRMSVHEGSAILNKTRDNFIESEMVGDSEAADVVYDSSPSAVGKTLSNISTLDEPLVYDGNEGLSSSSSSASDVHEAFIEVGSSPRPLEKNASSEDKDYVTVNERAREELASGSGGLWVASDTHYFDDEKELRSCKAISIKEHDTLQDGYSEVSEEFTHPIAAAGEISHFSSLPIVDSVSSDELPEDEDKNLHSGEDEIIDATPKETIIHPSEAGPELSHASISDLPSIPEEEHDTYLRESTEETRNDDDPKGQFSEPENYGAPVDSPAITIHDSGFTGLHLLEPTEIMDFSALSEMKFEPLIEADIDISDSRGVITNEVKSEQEGDCTEKLNDLDVESDDLVHAEVRGNNVIDEGLLSELDVVGDFHIEELKSDQGGPEVEQLFDGQFDSIMVDSSTEKQNVPPQLQDSGAKPNEDVNISPGHPSEPNMSNFEVPNPVTGEQNTVEPEFTPSSQSPPREGPEMTMYNSQLPVPELDSLEKVDSVLNQQHGEAAVPSASDLTSENSVTSNSEITTSGLDFINRDSELAETDSTMLVLEAKSAEDISLALKQLSEGDVYQTTLSEAEPSGTNILVEPVAVNSDLPEVEEKSLEDMALAFKDGTVENSSKLMEQKYGFTEIDTSDHIPEGAEVHSAEASERHLELEVGELQPAEEIELAVKEASERETGVVEEQNVEDGAEVHSAEASERHLELQVSELQSAEEKELAVKEASERETGVVEKQCAEDGGVTMADVSSFDAAALRKSKKKHKSSKSSSSSSSSDSE